MKPLGFFLSSINLVIYIYSDTLYIYIYFLLFVVGKAMRKCVADIKVKMKAKVDEFKRNKLNKMLIALGD